LGGATSHATPNADGDLGAFTYAYDHDNAATEPNPDTDSDVGSISNAYQDSNDRTDADTNWDRSPTHKHA
jgi:hypothetical protein